MPVAAMNDWIRLAGPQKVVELLGVRLVGINVENGVKLLFSLAFIAAMLLVGAGLRWLARRLPLATAKPVRFWADQGIKLATAIALTLGLLSIWFEDPARLTTALGLVTAGLTFALQRVVTAVAGYFVILRGRTFNIGDRIVMGGVRGDVIALDFTQTTIMEMGQPPPVQGAEPPMWVRSREYTGRIVTVTNAKIFDEPVYNYTRDFPYLWEELVLPVAHGADHARAESILLEAARRHTVSLAEMGEQAIREMQRRYFIKPAEMAPRVYQRLTDNWLELTVRFIVRDHGIRGVKDVMTREVLAALKEAGIGIGSETLQLVGLPTIGVLPDATQRRSS
jgi:small-conductance mechanosensitive channel